MDSGIIQHEMMHALGFYHEQSRPDRDDFVTIKWDAIPTVMYSNFDKYETSYVTTQDIAYDYGSVMHYAAYDFSQ